MCICEYVSVSVNVNVSVSAKYFSIHSAELKAMMAILDCRMPNLIVPLTAVIHHRGVCVVAQALLPISPSTLTLGSRDGGTFVHSGDTTSRSLLQQIGEVLNLKPHRVWNKQRTQHAILYGPGDMEVHGPFQRTDNSTLHFGMRNDFPV
jgi:hypothetical protein